MKVWWQEAQRRYDLLLVEQVAIDGPLRDVALYALTGGKRLRPILAEAIGEALAVPEDLVTRVALAVEYLHTASVLLDDLPAMDQASVRRGQPTAHLRYSEGEAILASMALMARAYAIVLATEDADRARSMGTLVSQAIGAAGMSGGQAEELVLEDHAQSLELEGIHARKTGALFSLIARLLAASAGPTHPDAEGTQRFAGRFAAAYQIADDLQDRDVRGEQRGNLACAMGVKGARYRALELLEEARRSAKELGARGARLEACTSWLEEIIDAVE
jgi:farnesyl diphosphate synthase